MLPLFVIRGVASCPGNIFGALVTTPTHIDTAFVCSFTISESVFAKIKGSAIVVQNLQSIFYASECTFDTCINTENIWVLEHGSGHMGGGIFVNILSSTITRCCSYRCSTRTGQFVSICTTEDQEISSVSCNQCGTVEWGTEDTLHCVYGNRHTAYDINCTSCVCTYDGAGFEFADFLSLHLSHCTVQNCTGTGIITLMVEDKFLDQYLGSSISRVNVFNNSVSGAEDEEKCIVYHLGTLTVSEWRFKGNSGIDGCISAWWAPDSPGYQPIGWNTVLTLVNCVSDKELKGDKLQLVNCRVSRDFETHEFHHMNTYLCVGAATRPFTSDRDSLRPKNPRVSFSYVWTYILFVN